jgi:hypothetical protein
MTQTHASEASLDMRRARQLEGRRYHPWLRRLGLVLMLAVLGLALGNVFGQRSLTSSAQGAAASLSISSPSRLRGGLLFTSRFTVVARRELTKPTLVLGPGWFEQMTFNAIAPNPNQQTSHNGAVSFSFERLQPGQRLVVWISWQVNPTNLADRPEDVVLADGTNPIVRIHRTLTVFP